jgi:hypothetical protein
MRYLAFLVLRKRRTTRSISGGLPEENPYEILYETGLFEMVALLDY